MKFTTSAIAAALLLASAPAIAQSKKETAASASASGTLMTKSGALPAPAPGKGQIVFFRPGSMMGMALGCTVREGLTQIARLGSGKYYVVQVEPGRHEYSSRGEGKDVLALEIEPDETYFVKCNIGMGVMSGRANLSPSDRAAFAKKAKGLKMWKGPGDDDGMKDEAAKPKG